LQAETEDTKRPTSLMRHYALHEVRVSEITVLCHLPAHARVYLPPYNFFHCYLTHVGHSEFTEIDLYFLSLSICI